MKVRLFFIIPDCCFIPEKLTTGTIFILRLIQEKILSQWKNICYAFANLKKAPSNVFLEL